MSAAKQDNNRDSVREPTRPVFMSRTLIHQQCRTLPRALYRSTQDRLSNRSSAFQGGWSATRHVHSSKAHSHHGHQPSTLSRQDMDHDLQRSKELKYDLRLLLRDIAQPVAVVTSFMPGFEGSTDSGAGTSSGRPRLSGASESAETDESSKFHGATLSSFTSIAMDPYPLVAFALRIPSRMATTLSSLASLSSSSILSTISQGKSLSSLSSHMVINLLSASQASAAVTFSRPDLYPNPFASGSHSKQHDYSLSKDGLPILHGAVGALSCKLISGPIPLYDLEYFGSGIGSTAKQPVLDDGGVASELFIARVTRVEKVPHDFEEEDAGKRTLPLVYHRRSYTSCHPRPGNFNDKNM